MHLNTTPATSNSDAGASADDISLDKDILRSQIRPRRLIARSHRGEHGQQQMQELLHRPHPRCGRTAGPLPRYHRGVPAHQIRAAHRPSANTLSTSRDTASSCPSYAPVANSPGCTGTPPLSIRSAPWASPNPKAKNKTRKPSLTPTCASSPPSPLMQAGTASVREAATTTALSPCSATSSSPARSIGVVFSRRNLRSYSLRPVGRHSTGDSHRAGHLPHPSAGLKAPGSLTPDFTLD